MRSSEILSPIERVFSPSNSNGSTSSSGRKSGLLSSRSTKCLVLGGLAASYGCSLGSTMENSADKTADVARFSGDLCMNVYELARDEEAATLTSSCMQGIIAGGIGALLVQNTLPLMVGLSGCLSKVSAQQRIGGEFQVNTYTTEGQWAPSAASFSNDNFVLTWNSFDQDNSSSGVYGQLFYGNTTKIGSEFQVNTYTGSQQESPSTVTFNNGNFAVVWQSYQDGSYDGIYGQLFYGNGTKFVNEFQVNIYTAGAQRFPSAASFINGNFIVTWESYSQDGSLEGVYGQLFDGNANRIGNEFQVNTYTIEDQSLPSAASFSNGNFIVTWQSNFQDGSDFGIYGQLFDVNANRIGNEFQANTHTNNSQENPSATSFINGNFVVTWQSNFQDGSDFGIYGQLFDGNANKIGNEFQINTHANSSQENPSAISFINSNFVVIWDSDLQDGSERGIYGQLFDGNANKLGNEFKANLYSNRHQNNPSTASFSNGNFVVTWQSLYQDGSNWGVYGQLFEGPVIISSTISDHTTQHLIKLR